MLFKYGSHAKLNGATRIAPTNIANLDAMPKSAISSKSALSFKKNLFQLEIRITNMEVDNTLKPNNITSILCFRSILKAM